jgi:REP element-mobilizing transposase RayT
VPLVWIPKYRKWVLTGQVALRVRDVLRQIALEPELEILAHLPTDWMKEGGGLR